MEFKFNGPTPDILKQQDEVATQLAIEEFLRRGGNIVECPPQEIERKNTAR